MTNFENWIDVAHQLDAQIRTADLAKDGVASAKYSVAVAKLSSHEIDDTTKSDIERLECFWAQETPDIDDVDDLGKKYLKIKRGTENPDGTGGPDHWLALLICGATTVLGGLGPVDVDVLCEAAEALDLDKEAVVRAIHELATTYNDCPKKDF